ncbi:MAG TPA: ABC transporter permease [Gemmatimonadaceae bacterium]|nr:ABC transporter permease [Gemmatimonadaceae bacterium]
MSILRKLRYVLGDVLFRGRRERELDAEFGDHLRREAEALEGAGWSPEAAASEARRRFGSVSANKDEAREQRFGAVADSMLRDARFGGRWLRRSPGFTTAALLTLALGIGATTAIFSILDTVILRPLPYRDDRELVTLWQHETRIGETHDLVSPANFRDWRARAKSIAQMGALIYWSVGWKRPDGVQSIDTWAASEDFFKVMDRQPALGRTFAPEEFVRGRENVFIATHGFWQRELGGDSTVIGRAFPVEEGTFTLVGVLPPGFELLGNRDLYIPMVLSEEDWNRRQSTYFTVVGRLAPNATVDQARAELATLGATLEREYPRENADVRIFLSPLRDELLGEARAPILLLAGAVICLLGVACANVANLLLVRSLARRREFALRAALGASGRRMVRQLVVESGVLAVAGGVAAILVAWGALRVFLALAPADVPRLQAATIDGRVLAFAFAITTLAALVCAIGPLARVLRGAPRDALQESSTSSTPSRSSRRWQHVLAAAQIGFALTLVIGAGLLVRSVQRLLAVERGFDGRNVASLTVQAWDEYPEPAARAAFANAMQERLRALPGVRHVGLTTALPLHDPVGNQNAGVVAVGSGLTDRDARQALAASVSPTYFETIGIALRDGRNFTTADDSASPHVVIVNEAFVREHFQGRRAIGERVRVSFSSAPVEREIVGVVADVRHEGLHQTPQPAVFLPFAQKSFGVMMFIVKADRPAATLLPDMRNVLTAIHPTMAIDRLTTVEQLLELSTLERRFIMTLLLGFSALALLLALVGTYGVVSHAMAARRREIAVRMALGASHGSVRTLVLRHGTSLALAGSVLGLVGAALLVQLLRASLFGISPFDPPTYTVATLLVLLAALLACLVPAIQAARSNAASVLRSA